VSRPARYVLKSTFTAAEPHEQGPRSPRLSAHGVARRRRAVREWRSRCVPSRSRRPRHGRGRSARRRRPRRASRTGCSSLRRTPARPAGTARGAAPAPPGRSGATPSTPSRRARPVGHRPVAPHRACAHRDQLPRAGPRRRTAGSWRLPQPSNVEKTTAAAPMTIASTRTPATSRRRRPASGPPVPPIPITAGTLPAGTDDRSPPFPTTCRRRSPSRSPNRPGPDRP
jgi:hypothetical protein